MAQDNSNAALNVLHWLANVAQDVWNLTIITVDNNAITIGTLCVGVALLVIGIFLSQRISKKIAFRVLTKLAVDVSVRHTLESLTFYILVVFFTLFALKMANVPLTIFTVIGGALAIGVGFGSQNLVSNFISGIILMLERPIKVGDFIEVDTVFGQVEHIGMRSTSILSYGNKEYIIPNSSFLEKNVLNWTYSDRNVQTSIKVGVAYGSPTRDVEKYLLEAINSEPGVLPDKLPSVFFTEFGDNCLIFELMFWIQLENLMDRRTLESNIRYRIDDLFRQNNIVISFPQRDVHLYPQGPIRVQMLNSSHTGA
jgi:small-conductance mechanosensitive channel